MKIIIGTNFCQINIFFLSNQPDVSPGGAGTHEVSEVLVAGEAEADCGIVEAEALLVWQLNLYPLWEAVKEEKI